MQTTLRNYGISVDQNAAWLLPQSIKISDSVVFPLLLRLALKNVQLIIHAKTKLDASSYVKGKWLVVISVVKIKTFLWNAYKFYIYIYINIYIYLYIYKCVYIYTYINIFDWTSFADFRYAKSKLRASVCFLRARILFFFFSILSCSFSPSLSRYILSLSFALATLLKIREVVVVDTLNYAPRTETFGQEFEKMKNQNRPEKRKEKERKEIVSRKKNGFHALCDTH